MHNILHRWFPCNTAIIMYMQRDVFIIDHAKFFNTGINQRIILIWKFAILQTVILYEQKWICPSKWNSFSTLMKVYWNNGVINFFRFSHTFSGTVSSKQPVCPLAGISLPVLTDIHLTPSETAKCTFWLPLKHTSRSIFWAYAGFIIPVNTSKIKQGKRM